MSTLILPPRFTQDTIALGKTAGREGWNVERLSSWRVPAEERDPEIVIYGEPLFVSVVSKPLGIDLLEPSIGWLPDLSEKYRKRVVHLSTLGAARKIPGAAFIKPVSDKTFSARVYATGAELPPAPTDAGDDEPVLVSEPVQWELEFRAFILERNVTTLSPYLRRGHLIEEPDGRWPASDEELRSAEKYIEMVVGDASVDLPPSVVLDFGTIPGRGWAVIEANAAWGSGIYGCDPSEVLRTIRRSCVASAKLDMDDRRWRRA